MLKENFVEFLEKSIKDNWAKEALSDYQGDTLKYKEIADRITRLHIGFKEAGIKPGDKIALIGKNSANWSVVFLATVTYGAVIVPILPDFTSENIHHIVNHSESILFFAAEDIFPNFNPEEITGLRGIFSLDGFTPLYVKDDTLDGLDEKVDHIFEEKFPSGIKSEDFQTKKVDNSKLAEISYTSGTTGYSKGVMISHNSLIANIRFAHNNMPLEPGDKILSFLPLAHSYGCAFEFL